jgi:hypothetical protein
MADASRDSADRQQQVDARLLVLGSAMAEHLPAMAAVLVTAFQQRIEELRGDPGILDLLAASTASNLDNMAHLLQGHLRLDEVRIPLAAEDYARRLAQRGVSPNALARAYRIGHQVVLEWCLDQLTASGADLDVVLASGRSLIATAFTYVDTVSEAALSAYESERERWLANRNTLRLEVLEALISGDRIDVAAAESALGYRLRQHHLGVLLWNSDAVSGTNDLRQLEQLLAQIARALGSTGQPLFVPRDRATGWGWVPLGRDAGAPDLAGVHQLMEEADPAVRVAIGTTGPGDSAFRASHLEALRAQRVAIVAQSRAGRVTSYADPRVRAAALLAADLDSTRRLVVSALGDLAADSEPAARLRETLQVFLSERDSCTATGSKMHLHKNTVRYRVARAIEARGKPLDQDRLDLQLALIACEWLGSEVLPAVPHSFRGSGPNR